MLYHPLTVYLEYTTNTSALPKQEQCDVRERGMNCTENTRTTSSLLCTYY